MIPVGTEPVPAATTANKTANTTANITANTTAITAAATPAQKGDAMENTSTNAAASGSANASAQRTRPEAAQQPGTAQPRYDYEALKQVIQRLRSPEGCPWDRAQTHESLKRYLIEETYETLEAIDIGDPEKIRDELGDVLLQVLLHAEIASERGQFNMDDVVHGVAAKMIARHRHVFGDEEAATAEEVVALWERVKKEEKGQKTHTQNLLDVPPHLPALMRGYKVQHKAAKAGFDWDHIDGAWAKVREEMAELEAAAAAEDRAHMAEELGDLLFAVVNVSRFMDVQPELALTGTIEKFIRRFSAVEEMTGASGAKLEEMTLAQMDALWDRVKEKERETHET